VDFVLVEPREDENAIKYQSVTHQEEKPDEGVSKTASCWRATSYLPNQLAASNAPPSGHGPSLSGVIPAGDTADGPLLRAV